MKKLIIFILPFLLLFSCSTPKEMKECNEIRANGNLGLSVNSVDNEPLIKIVDNELVYLTNDLNNNYNLFQIKRNESLLTKLDNIIKLNNLITPGLPTSYVLEDNKILYVVSALSKDSSNRDLFAFLYVNGNYARMYDSEVLNSSGFEGHPFFYENKLFFTKEVLGQWDIYSSEFNEGNWSPPVAVEFVNTNADEGFYSRIGERQFFSRRSDGKFNIFSTKRSYTSNPYQLNSIINSKSNDISPILFNNSIYLSSDREGGCGEFDLYSFDFCSDISLTGNIISEFENVPLKGIVELYSADSVLLEQYIIPNNAKFDFKLAANNSYYLVYKNDCYNTIKTTDLFFAECNEENNVLLQQDIYLPNYTVEFNFEEYDIPFFVTGYYRPNTSDNLKELKSLFNLGVIKDKGNTSYIEYPDDKYHEYSVTIDSAFDDAIGYINDKLNSLNNDCVINDTKIVLDITGFSDPRDIAPNKVYPGPDIYDDKGNVAVKNGEAIDNELLSFIRAYYTGDYIKSKVKDNKNIVVNMFTGGIDEKSDRPNDLKRRVKISIRLESQ